MEDIHGFILLLNQQHFKHDDRRNEIMPDYELN